VPEDHDAVLVRHDEVRLGQLVIADDGFDRWKDLLSVLMGEWDRGPERWKLDELGECALEEEAGRRDAPGDVEVCVVGDPGFVTAGPRETLSSTARQPDRTTGDGVGAWTYRQPVGVGGRPAVQS
jgi:hypothetical protein